MKLDNGIINCEETEIWKVTLALSPPILSDILHLGRINCYNSKCSASVILWNILPIESKKKFQNFYAKDKILEQIKYLSHGCPYKICRKLKNYSVNRNVPAT